MLNISKANINLRFVLKLQTEEETQHHFRLPDPAALQSGAARPLENSPH